ncbi:tyrosine-type recombinase/integrase [Sorangium sp. So ce394]|uniref:tyrosine-type recombinase/integrase n=1 Tax=Sorangium sp. So ce394 TaxID=3133310 RepID=UPI003F5C5842
MLSELAGRLLAAGQIVLGLPLLEQAAAREGTALRDVRLAIDHLCRGEARARASGETTFAEFAERVVSGKLAEQYPDHVKAIRRPDLYRGKLKYLLDVLGPVPLARLTLDHADRAMSLLPRHLGTGSRRNIAGFIHRILALAAYPARVIGSNPLPRGWAPKADADKAKGYLYPDEDQLLMESTSVPLCFRIYYGFLIREGMRAEEAGQLEWSDVDLERGAVVLDENKTDDPRAWALSPDVVRALRKWREVCPDKVRVFVGKWGSNSLPGQNGAARFRDHLRRAGITRPELFETTDSRLNIRLHDTRATFITIKLANGRTETWISDRTGHRSSGQIHHYKRAARKVAELGLGDFAPLDEAIPELRGDEGSVGAGGPVGAAPEARAANEAASALPSQAPAARDVAGPLEADLEAPESGRLGPRWAIPEASAVEHRPETIEIIDLHADRSAAPGKSWRHVHREMGATHLSLEARPPGDGCHPSPGWTSQLTGTGSRRVARPERGRRDGFRLPGGGFPAGSPEVVDHLDAGRQQERGERPAPRDLRVGVALDLLDHASRRPRGRRCGEKVFGPKPSRRDDQPGHVATAVPLAPPLLLTPADAAVT